MNKLSVGRRDLLVCVAAALKKRLTEEPVAESLVAKGAVWIWELWAFEQRNAIAVYKENYSGSCHGGDGEEKDIIWKTFRSTILHNSL